MKKFLILCALLGFIAIPASAQEEAISTEVEPAAIEEVQAEEVTPEASAQEVVEVPSTVFEDTEVTNYKEYKISGLNKAPKKNELVIYTPNSGKSTNSSTKGIEAVVVNNRVVKINHYNSYIPENGFVISGVGNAKKFILNNIFEGADVDVDFDKALLKVVTHSDNYIYEADFRIQKMKEILANSDENEVNTYNMNFYIKRAEEILYRTKKLVQFNDFENAQKMAKDSMAYSDMALYSSLAYKADEFKGIWVFPYQKTEEEIEQAFDIIKRLNLNNIFLEVYYNGATAYDSKVVAKYGLKSHTRYFGGFDPLAAWIEFAKKYDKKVYVTFNTFEVGKVANSTKEESIISVKENWILPIAKSAKQKEYYLDPANLEVQNYILELMHEVATNYDIAGILAAKMDYPSSAEANSEKITEFANKFIALKEAYPELQIAISVRPENVAQDFSKWNLDEKIVLMPVLTSPDNDFANDYLSQVLANANGSTIYPIYTEPYQEEKPRRLFDQIATARKLGINGIVLYDLDYLNKEYYDALRLVIFREPSKKKGSFQLIKKEDYSSKKSEEVEK